MQSQGVDIGLVTPDPQLVKRVEAIATEFEYSLKHFPSIDEFLESKTGFKLLVIYVKDEGNPRMVAELAQSARYVSADGFLICGAPKSIPKDVASFAKRSGANLLVLEPEFFETSKLDFTITQVLKAAFLPIKATDLVADRPVPFDLYHLLPQRKKFLKFLFEGDVPEMGKIQKIATAGEVYIGRAAAGAYKQYVVGSQDKSAAGLAKRCRAQFLALYASYSNLVFMLTDQSEQASFGDGAKLLSECQQLCEELLSALGEFGNAWDVINNSSIGEFGSVERAPAIAAYAALFAMQLEFKKIDQIMLGALLSDLGLVLLPPSITTKLREGRIAELAPEELAAFRSYPTRSLDVVLSRKLSIDEKTRQILVSTCERADGTGFPKGLVGTKISEEAQLIQFCREFDSRTLLKLGRARVSPEDVREKLILEDLGICKRYTDSFLKKMREAFPPPVR